MKPKIEEVKKSDSSKVYVTKNRSDIESFYKIRNDIYINENRYGHKKWQQTAHDESLVIVANRSGKISGGARLTFSVGGELLSDEYQDSEFLYKNLLKKCDVDENSPYCQIEDLVMDRGLRDGECVTAIAQLCVDEARVRGVENIFFIASAAQCKLYGSYFRKTGCREVKIFNEMIWKKIPEYNFSEDHPALVII